MTWSELFRLAEEAKPEPAPNRPHQGQGGYGKGGLEGNLKQWIRSNLMSLLRAYSTQGKKTSPMDPSSIAYQFLQIVAPYSWAMPYAAGKLGITDIPAAFSSPETAKITPGHEAEGEEMLELVWALQDACLVALIDLSSKNTSELARWLDSYVDVPIDQKDKHLDTLLDGIYKIFDSWRMSARRTGMRKVIGLWQAAPTRQEVGEKKGETVVGDADVSLELPDSIKFNEAVRDAVEAVRPTFKGSDRAEYVKAVINAVDSSVSPGADPIAEVKTEGSPLSKSEKWKLAAETFATTADLLAALNEPGAGPV